MNTNARDVARARVAELVANFKRNESDYLSAPYNETQARTDFITPLLGAFGWDVYNAAGQPLGLREVIEEATVEVGEERISKRPDYELRLARQRKLFVEAKKPSVRIDRIREPAFQTRRYGYSGSLPISVLTNFHQLAIYDCQPAPSTRDEAHVARIMLLGYEELERRFDELWPLLSREAVYSGEFDRLFTVGATRHGTEQFDDFFLAQVRSWRGRLAIDIHRNCPELTPTELTYAVQLFLSRIVFLRICEDREIERYETLRGLTSGNAFDALMAELRRADEFYNSGLFRLLDDESLGVRIGDAVLAEIIEELYYPQSPYTFSVVETEVLGQIYEQFLGEVITFDDAGNVEIVSKPEVRESGGVVPTPRYIVDSIVSRTLGPALAGKSPAQLAQFTAADICCGSGVFLLSVFELLCEHHLTWYLTHSRNENLCRTIFEAGQGEYRLTYEEKRRIAVTHIRGVDIDPNAVEVARFSLLLKLIEDETAAGLRDFVERTHEQALPTLDDTIVAGNSLVSEPEWVAARGAFPQGLLEKVNPLSWGDVFPEEMGRGGFDVVVGNPPYIRIQNMAAYSPEEVAFYHSAQSPYSTAQQDNFDKYTLFVERSLALSNEAGRLGFIIPHKFMTIQSGRSLRHLLTSAPIVENIVHFGVQQIFGRHAANYTCLLILNRPGTASVNVERVEVLEAWRYSGAAQLTEVAAADLGEEPWRFADEPTRELLERVRGQCNRTLGEAAEIYVGVQTSADQIYIFEGRAEAANTISLDWNGRLWPIEKGILRPCLMDAPIAPFERVQPNRWMIFPYRLEDENGTTIARLIQPPEMEEMYPNCLAYLRAREAELNKRNIVGGRASERQFYQFGRSQSLTKFNSAKIILPILSLEARYGFDEHDTMVTGGGNGPYYMVRPVADAAETNLFLLAVLHHPLCEAMVRMHTSAFRGGYYSHGKQFIEGLPVPPATQSQREDIEGRVSELIAAKDAAQGARTPFQRIRQERMAASLRAQIERRVTALYDLSEDDMATILAVPPPG